MEQDDFMRWRNNIGYAYGRNLNRASSSAVVGLVLVACVLLFAAHLAGALLAAEVIWFCSGVVSVLATGRAVSLGEKLRRADVPAQLRLSFAYASAGWLSTVAFLIVTGVLYASLRVKGGNPYALGPVLTAGSIVLCRLSCMRMDGSLPLGAWGR